MKTSLLQYTDVDDKCYGVAGMAIGMFIFDYEQYLVGVSVEKSDLESLEFAPELMFAQNSSLSPKVVWSHIFKRFNLAAGLLLSNVLCRYYIHRHQGLKSELRAEIIDRLLEEADDTCQLEKDEVENLFNKNFSYLDQAFRTPSVAHVAAQMAAELRQRSHLSNSEIIEMMSAMS